MNDPPRPATTTSLMKNTGWRMNPRTGALCKLMMETKMVKSMFGWAAFAAVAVIGSAAFADDYSKCTKVDKGGYFTLSPVGCAVIVKTHKDPAPPKKPDPVPVTD